MRCPPIDGGVNCLFGVWVQVSLEKLVASHADWWMIAGYGDGVADDSARWLDAAKPVPAPIEADQEAADPPRSRPVLETRAPEPGVDPLAAMPADLATFQAWLPTSPAAQWGGVVVGPSGTANSVLMIISEFPEAEDEPSAQLHSDRAGELLDAMLAAIGVTRDHCYFASLAVTRPPGGRIADDQRKILDAMMLHHIALAAPQRLILLGNRMSRLFGAADVVDARSRLLEINQNGVNMVAVAIYHPRFLLGRPHYKAISWSSLKRLRKKP
jgi:DNA polymerase